GGGGGAGGGGGGWGGLGGFGGFPGKGPVGGPPGGSFFGNRHIRDQRHGPGSRPERGHRATPARQSQAQSAGAKSPRPAEPRRRGHRANRYERAVQARQQPILRHGATTGRRAAAVAHP